MNHLNSIKRTTETQRCIFDKNIIEEINKLSGNHSVSEILLLTNFVKMV